MLILFPIALFIAMFTSGLAFCVTGSAGWFDPTM